MIRRLLLSLAAIVLIAGAAFFAGLRASLWLVSESEMDRRQRIELSDTLLEWVDDVLYRTTGKVKGEQEPPFDPSRLIRFPPTEAEGRRQTLTAFIFSGASLPTQENPEAILKGADVDVPVIGRVAKIWTIKHVQRFGIETETLIYEPAEAAHCFFIYHAGHNGDIWTVHRLIRSALHSRCIVATMQMPLEAGQPAVVVDDPSLGPIHLNGHNDLALLDGIRGFNPLSLFVRPVVQVVNVARTRFGADTIMMAGFSGGGWTTTLAAAIDTRIDRAVTISGGLPSYLRTNVKFMRQVNADYELANGRLLRTANELEQYVLASLPGRRSFTQILEYNQGLFDARQGRPYIGVVQEFVAACRCGGQFTSLADPSVVSHEFTGRAEMNTARILFDE